MHREYIKRFLKNCIPWRIRYFLKLQEAKGNFKFPNNIKQRRLIEEYNDMLYSALEVLEIKDFRGMSVCEMGVGQFLSHAFLEYQLGAEEETLLEIADFANVDSLVDESILALDCSYNAVRLLPELTNEETWETYLKKIHAIYRTDGLCGYKSVSENSVDFLFSFAVLEHIRKNIFMETMSETFRFMRRGGVAYHVVDFTDHFGGGKNQLRFSENVWENEEHYRMENYTNRLQCSEICRMLEKVGFDIVKVRTERFRREPINRRNLDKQFANISGDDLQTARATMIIRKS